jgi:hypothetical protein
MHLRGWEREVVAVEPTQTPAGVLGRARTGAGRREGGKAAPRSLVTGPVISRRAVVGGGLVGLGGLLLFPGQMLAKAVPNGSFAIFLSGPYQPVMHGPDLGLSTVDLNDGSFSTVRIFPVSGIPGNSDPQKAIGNFYVQFAGDLCAYHIPGGSLAMQFTGSDYDVVDDGAGGVFWDGTFELTILEATGVYRRFAGGHNHMVDKLHLLAPGDGSGGAVENCICNVSAP